MDELIKQGQWWWLVAVPVLTGALALLGSWWGSRLGKKTEHAQWLRNAKETAYVEFLDRAQTLLTEAHWTPQYGPERVEWGKERILAIRPTVIYLLAPDDIRDLAKVIHGRLMWLSSTLSRESADQPHVKKSKEAVGEELERLSGLCRAELMGS
jgi:hypothetical protein